MSWAISMLPMADMVGRRLKRWKTKPMRARRILVRSASERREKSVPSMVTEPLVAGVRPPRMWKRVDLPEPEGPTMATNSPGQISKLTLRSASTCTLPER